VHYQYAQLYDSEWLDLLDPAAAAKLSIAEGTSFTFLKGGRLATAPTAAALLEDVRKARAPRPPAGPPLRGGRRPRADARAPGAPRRSSRAASFVRTGRRT